MARTTNPRIQSSNSKGLDGKSTESSDPTDVSAALAARPKDPSDEAGPMLPGGPSDPPQQQNIGQLGNPKDKNEPTLPSRSSGSSGDEHSNNGETNSNSEPSGNGKSAKEKFIDLHNLLLAFDTALKHPSNVPKHNKVRMIIRNTDLNEYYTRDLATEPLFTFAEQANELESEDALFNSFIKRAAGWMRTASLIYDHLQKACIEESGEGCRVQELFRNFLPVAWEDICTVLRQEQQPRPTGCWVPTRLGLSGQNPPWRGYCELSTLYRRTFGVPSQLSTSGT